MPLQNPSYRAEADIAPSVFVQPGSLDHNILPADGSVAPLGVMHESIWDTPIPGADAAVAVPAGESKRVYGLGEVCMVRVGAGDVTVGMFVKPDAAGGAIASTAGQVYGGIVLEGAEATGLALIQVLISPAAA